MPVGFYELLQIAPDATAEAVRAAWQDQVAQVVRKMRNAEAKKLDRAPIEARRLGLNEAYAVLSDPARRRRYDRFREISRTGLPTDPDELWRAAGPSLVDPGAAAAIEVIRSLTEIKVGPPFTSQPERAPVKEVTSPGFPAAVSAMSAISEESPSVSVQPLPSIALEPVDTSAPRRPPLTTGRVAPKAGPVIDRSASTEALARLFDQYGPTGAFLRAIRDVRRITTADLSGITRISQRFIDAMEADAYTDLPGATFVRGYLKMLLRALEALDGSEVDEFIEGYMSRFNRARG
jgi:curved DNA-binding protein CbpA